MRRFHSIVDKHDSSKLSVLVTGGAGYIGSHVVLACQNAGYHVVVLDDFSTGFRASVSDVSSVIEADIADFDTVTQVIGAYNINSVIHLAASTSVSTSIERPIDYYINNTEKSLHLIRACVQSNVRNFIYSSTAAVYGISSHVPIPEEAVTCPINPYGRSKLMTEWMIRDAALSCKFNYAILRFCNVAGADPDGKAGSRGKNDHSLIKIASEAAVGKRRSVTIFGVDYDTRDGSCIRDYIHVSDIASANVAALTRMESESRDFQNMVLNCGYGFGASVFEVLEAVRAEGPERFEVTEGPRRAGDVPVLVADASRIQQCLDWSPRHNDLGSIIRSSIAWERRH